MLRSCLSCHAMLSCGMQGAKTRWFNACARDGLRSECIETFIIQLTTVHLAVNNRESCSAYCYFAGTRARTLKVISCSTGSLLLTGLVVSFQPPIIEHVPAGIQDGGTDEVAAPSMSHQQSSRTNVTQSTFLNTVKDPPTVSVSPDTAIGSHMSDVRSILFLEWSIPISPAAT